jgi:hypothetical protein
LKTFRRFLGEGERELSPRNRYGGFRRLELSRQEEEGSQAFVGCGRFVHLAGLFLLTPWPFWLGSDLHPMEISAPVLNQVCS